jgi:hypothetical protein
MEDSSTGFLIGAAVIVVVAAAIFLAVWSSRRAKAALVEFASSRGLSVEPLDQGEELERRVVESLGVPAGGIYRDIVRLPLSAGEAYLFTKAPETKGASSDTGTGGSPHQFIVVFMDIAVSGRTFAARAIPVAGKLGERMVEFVLNKVFGATGIKRLDTSAYYPDFSKVYNVFTEDEEGARSVVLSSGVVSCLMTHPQKEPVNISIGPKGFGVDITSVMKSRQEIDRFVDWADDLARVLKDR